MVRLEGIVLPLGEVKCEFPTLISSIHAQKPLLPRLQSCQQCSSGDAVLSFKRGQRVKPFCCFPGGVATVLVKAKFIFCSAIIEVQRLLKKLSRSQKQ